ncbi:MAG: hypothetical protein GY930_00090 [bacterium]|nr:hypothetical protein [bacterium]
MWNLLLPIALLIFPYQRNLTGAEPRAQDPDAGAPQELHLQSLARDIEKQVAEIRGLAFKRPVEVHFASKETFFEYFKTMEQRMGGEERAECERQLAVLLQLVPSGLDIGAAQQELMAGQVGGFYDPGEEAFFVMEGLADDLIRIIMAHELTHALDDQYYDLAAKDLELLSNNDALLAHHAVIEGSAQVVMGQWFIKNLGTLDRKAIMEFQKQVDLQAMSEAPRLLWKPILALYSQGQAFLSRTAKLSIFSKADVADLDRALKNLPSSTEQILHPKKYWSEKTLDLPHQVRQDLSQLPEGWSSFHTDVLGELFLGLLSLPGDGALNAGSMLIMQHTDASTSGWGGDRAQIFAKGDARVLVLDTFWDTAKDAGEFAAALEGREVPPDSGPKRADSFIEHGKGTRWVRLVAWFSSSRKDAEEVARLIPVSADQFGKISTSRIPVDDDSSK